MIETTNPEIDVNELMERVRRVAAESSALPDAFRPQGSGARAAAATQTPPPPPITLPTPLASIKDQVAALLDRAYAKNQVSSWIPAILRGLFRRQGGFNRAALETLSILAETTEQLNDRVRALSAAAIAQEQWLRTLARQRRIEAAWRKAAHDRIDQWELEMQRVQDLEKDAKRTSEHLRDLQTELKRLDFRETLAQLDERLTSDSSFIKSELAHHRTLLHESLVPRPNKSPVKRAGAESASALPPGDPLDAFYVSFEDRFRGPRSDIANRLRFYLPFLRAAKAGSATCPILDLGCGRGEWLELLRDENLTGSGVDLNAAMCRQCAEHELAVVHGDALQHLRSMATGGCGAVTGFHIIEHLPFNVLMMVLAETYRVLQPGGLAIFESPNCKNLIVGASTFNIDPTHRNPVFPETARFMLERTGFERVAIEYLSPGDRQPFSQTGDGILLNELLFGSQDFAVIGHKSGSP